MMTTPCSYWYLQEVEVQSLIKTIITTTTKVTAVLKRLATGILKSGKVMNKKERKVAGPSGKW